MTSYANEGSRENPFLDALGCFCGVDMMRWRLDVHQASGGMFDVELGHGGHEIFLRRGRLTPRKVDFRLLINVSIYLLED